MTYSSLTVPLPRDSGNKSFNGPAGKVFKGVEDPGNEDEASVAVVLFGPDGETPISTIKGVFVQGPDATGQFANANPLIIGGVSETTTPVPQADTQVVKAWFDEYGALGVRVKDANQTDVDFTKRPSTSNAVNDIGVAATATSTSLRSANSDRTGMIITNTDTNEAYVRYSGSAASSSNFTVKIPGGWTWEMPEPIWLGAMTVIWAATAGGNMVGSEFE